jgi:hypothetical protein
VTSLLADFKGTATSTSVSNFISAPLDVYVDVRRRIRYMNDAIGHNAFDCIADVRRRKRSLNTTLHTAGL